MNEVERILGLVGSGKVSRSEAARLIGALSPGLARLSDQVWERTFAQLDHGMAPADLAQLLSVGLEPAGVGRGFSVTVDRPTPARERTSRVMRLEIDGSDGTEVRVNLPLGLANFAMKLIPREAQSTLAEKGLDMALLAELLKNDLPEGQLLEVEGSDGSEIRLSIQ